MKLKIDLYILSLWMLFFLLFLNKIEIPICFDHNWQYIGIWRLININWIPILCIVGMLYGIWAFGKFKNRVIDSSKQGPWKIEAIDNISFENLSFLATYIIPLLCFDLDFHLDQNRNGFMLLLVLIVIGAIYIKANLYYTNPTLALMNFRIYSLNYNYQGSTKKCIVLSRSKLKVNDVIVAKHIDENIYYVKKSSL
jgi:hypothetical protein